jgi:hypothetical protein
VRPDARVSTTVRVLPSASWRQRRLDGNVRTKGSCMPSSERRIASLSRWLPIALTLALAAGCARDRISTSPPDPESAGPVFIQEIGTRGDHPASQDGDDDHDDWNRATKWINGSTGGTIENGRFSVTFAPGAFSGSRRIELIDSTDEYLECQLFPEGIYFTAPVVLTVDLEGTNGDDQSTTVYWNDDDTWVDVGSWYSSGEHTVSTDLDHFSEYRPGRAGW